MKLYEKILMSLTFTLFMSGLTGLVGFLFKDSFMFWFILAFLVQFFGFILVNNILKVLAKFKIKQWEIDLMKEASKNLVVMNCASCNDPNEIILNVNEDNKFRCKQCGVENSVIINYMNAQTTNPIYKRDILTESDIEKLEQIKFDD